jgi:hypothetical protein
LCINIDKPMITTFININDIIAKVHTSEPLAKRRQHPHQL